MRSVPRRRSSSPFILIPGKDGPSPTEKDQLCEGASHLRDLDWSILMAHAQAGDAEAYRRLLTDITPYLRRLAARRHRQPSDIEDAVQDILLTLHAIRETYDPTRPFGPWLRTIAEHRIVDRLRRRMRRQSRETPLAPEHETFAAASPNLADRMSDNRDLANALTRLSDGQRRAIQLLKLEGMSLKEAAAATGMSVTALKLATHRALRNLRKFLAGKERP